MRVLVTRPREDAERIAGPLRALGVSVINEPLLVIVPMAGPTVGLDDVQAVLVTSANGVRALAKAVETRSVPVYAVGDQSARAAKELGFAKVESAGGDVEALAHLVESALDPGDGPLLHAAGSVHAGDLAGSLQEKGFTVRLARLYDARPTAALSASVRSALAAGEIAAGFFFSPRTARTFAEHARKAGLPVPLPGVVGYALSPAVAHELDSLLAEPARVADAPTQEALLALFQADLKEGILKPSESTPSETSDQPEQTPASDESSSADAAASDASHDDVGAGHESRSSDDDEGVYAGSATAGADDPESAQATARTAEEQADHRTLQRIGGWFLVLFVLVAVGFGSMPWWWHKVPQPFQSWLPELPAAPEPPGVADLRSQVEALSAEVASVSQTVSGVSGSVDELSTRLDGAAAADALADLRQKIAELEARPAPVAAAGPSDGAETEGAAATPAAPTVDPARVEALGSELSELSEQVASLRSRLDALETAAQGRAQSETLAANRLVAIGQLRLRVDSGEPYSNALDAAESLGIPESAEPAMQTLAEGAQTGVATLPDLRRRYAVVSRAAARRTVVPEGTGWFSDTVSSLMDSVTVRRKGEVVVGGALGALAAAEARLNEGDLTGALDALAEVEGDPAKELTDWLADARLRASVDAALSALTTAALERLGAAEKTE